jgi:hypothetical protein
MKNTFIAILLGLSLCANAQCKDVYNNPADCPTTEDSLVLYNNAIKVIQFYDSNDIYHLTKSDKITDSRGIFDDLTMAKRMFNIIRRELRDIKEDKFSAGKPKQGYKDITYSQYYDFIDENRFYQRELENQIINANAPMSMYDQRISPILMNTYVCIDSNSVYFNDLVNIPLYVPVVVKPYNLLTEPELVVRNQILGIKMPIKYKRNAVKRDSLPIKSLLVRNDSVISPVNNFYDYSLPKLPVYLYNNYGSACVIGFMQGRYFKKLTINEYADYAVSTFARFVLEDPVLLDKALRLKFGAYYLGLLP